MAWNEGRKAFDTAAAVLAKRLVKINSSGLVLHNTEDDTDPCIGVAEYGVESGDVVGVKLINLGGSQEIIAADAIAVGADVYAADEGKVSALPAVAGDYRKIGIALQAATADGDAIEVLTQGTPSVTTVS